jgi:hypothetical protein
MRFLIALFALMATSVALANPFDAFVGDYTLVGKSVIQKSGSARECIRFNFENLVGFSVVADTAGYQQTHMLHFVFDGTSGHGWFGHPVMEYNYKNEFGTGGSYAKTSGDQNIAKNEYTTWSNNSIEPLTVSIQRSGSQYLLLMTEVYSRNSQVEASCTYQATLNKK